MNGVLNTGLEFWQLIVGIIVITLSIVTIKIAISFDLNKFLERKDSRLSKKIKNTCPHVEIEQVDKENFSIKSLFESPAGTLQWQCQRCGLKRNHNDDYKKVCEYWGNHTDEYVERMKQFQKLLKKGGAV